MKTITIDKKQYNVFAVEFCGETCELYFIQERYADNRTLAVEAYTADTQEPFATLTVNLCDPHQVQKNHAFFDINNCGSILKQLEKLGICKKAADGYQRQSGWVTFPLYEWNVDLFRAGEKKTKYYIDYQRHAPDGRVLGDMGWHFDVRPETETEDLGEAKENARKFIQDFPYDSEDGAVVMEVVDEHGKTVFTVANCLEEDLWRYEELKADEFAGVTEE